MRRNAFAEPDDQKTATWPGGCIHSESKSATGCIAKSATTIVPGGFNHHSWGASSNPQPPCAWASWHVRRKTSFLHPRPDLAWFIAADGLGFSLSVLRVMLSVCKCFSNSPSGRTLRVTGPPVHFDVFSARRSPEARRLCVRQPHHSYPSEVYKMGVGTILLIINIPFGLVSRFRPDFPFFPRGFTQRTEFARRGRNAACPSRSTC